jgi:hypothetical protein
VPTTPINGLPSPDSSSPNNPPIHFDALNAVLDSRLVARFPSIAARNAAIPSPVEGQLCHIAQSGTPLLPPRLMAFDGTAGIWRGLKAFFLPSVPFTAWTNPVLDNAVRTIATLTVPDPGFPYYLRTFAGAEIGPAPGSTDRVDSNMIVDNVIWDYWRGDVGHYHKHADVSPIAFSGSKTIYFNAFRALTGNGGGWTSTAALGYFRCEVSPA